MAGGRRGSPKSTQVAQAHETAIADAPPPAEWVDLRTLQPWARNPRHNEPAVTVVQELLLRYGFGAPMQAWGRDGVRRIVAGHTRRIAYLAAMAADATWLCRATPRPWLVPVRWVDHLSEAEASELALADNKSNELATWDEELLAELSAEMDLTGLGWDQGELDQLLAEVTKEDRLWAIDAGGRAGPLNPNRVMVTLMLPVTVAESQEVEEAIQQEQLRSPGTERGPALMEILRRGREGA